MANVKTCPWCGENTTVYYTTERWGQLVRYRKCTGSKYHGVTVEIDRTLYEKLIGKGDSE